MTASVFLFHYILKIILAVTALKIYNLFHTFGGSENTDDLFMENCLVNLYNSEKLDIPNEILFMYALHNI